MRRLALLCSLFLFAFALPQAARAQDADKPAEAAKPATPTPNFYHLVFVVQEIDAANKPINSRTYTTTVGTSTSDYPPQSIRTGSRIPIATESSESNDPKESGRVQFQYIDVGINFDIRHVTEVRRQLSLNLSADVSSVAEASDPHLHQPVIRQNKWQASVLIPIGKPTVIFTSDSLDSKGSLQVTVTATPLQ